MRPHKNHHHAKPTSTLPALRRVDGTEVALPEALIESAKGFAKHSRAESTRRNYGMWWKDFTRWCNAHGREPLPASIDTVIAYVTALATRSGTLSNGKETGRTLSISSISMAMAAIKLAQRTGGHGLDSDHPMLKEVLKGIRRERAKVRTVRRVKPLMKDVLSEIIEGLAQRPDNLRETRDAALLALGWAGAMRRSELVGLDWKALGASEDKYRTGFIEVDDKGILVTLMTSKASQDTAQTIIIPRDFAPLICKAVEAWTALAKIERGAPLFRPMKGRAPAKRLGATRFTSDSVARLIRMRVKTYLAGSVKGWKKLTTAERNALVAEYAGHSLRSGYVSSAANADIPTHRIMKHTRHKTEAMVGIYIRDSDIRKNSGLKGVAF